MIKGVLFLSLVVLVACIPGGWNRVDVDDEEVKVAASVAAEGLSKQFASKYHHKLVKIIKAERQTVAGTNFRLEVVVGLTDCKKEDVVNYEETETCDILDKGASTYKKCTTNVFRDLNGNHRKSPGTGCMLISRKDI